jgi:hypothetical protein
VRIRHVRFCDLSHGKQLPIFSEARAVLVCLQEKIGLRSSIETRGQMPQDIASYDDAAVWKQECR